MTWCSENSTFPGFVLASSAIHCRFVDRFARFIVPSLFPGNGSLSRRLPSLFRVPVSPVPRSPRYYEGATTSHSRIHGRLFGSLPQPTRFLLSFVSRLGAPGSLEFASWPGPFVVAGRPAPASLAWTRMGSLRSPDVPSRAFAVFQDPGRIDVSSPLTATSMLPPFIGQRRLRR